MLSVDVEEFINRFLMAIVQKLINRKLQELEFDYELLELVLLEEDLNVKRKRKN